MDYLNKITIQGFRLFKESRSVEFSTPDGTFLGLNIIVGPNNVGKSSLVNLIGANYWGQINQEDWSASEPRVVLESNQKSVMVQYQKGGLGNPIYTYIPEGSPPNLISMYLPSNRSWAFEAANPNFGPGLMTLPPNPSDIEIAQNLTNAVHILSGSYASNKNYEIQSKPTEQFIGTLLLISLSDDLKEKYRTLVREFISNYQDYELLRKRGNKYQVLYRSADTSEYIDMALVGDGVQTIMVICAYLILIREGSFDSPSQTLGMLVMDEPETSLHPQAQKRLYKYIKELSTKIQVIYATHSPYMMSWDAIDQGGRIIRIDSPKGNQAEVYTLSKEDKIKFTTQPRRQSNLDTISREIVFTDKVVIVEGLDDANILRAYIEHEDLNYDYEICGHGADGSGSIIKWMKVASKLGIKCACIYDHDVNEHFQSATQVFGSDLVKQWSTDDIRDKKGCIGCSKGEKSGLFVESGAIKEESRVEVNKILRDINTALST